MTGPLDGNTSPFVTYAIADPQTGRYVYVGQTKDFEERRHAHLRRARRRPRIKTSNIKTWLFDCLSSGVSPEFVILEHCSSIEDSLASEQRWVERFASEANPLINRWRAHRTVIKHFSSIASKG